MQTIQVRWLLPALEGFWQYPDSAKMPPSASHNDRQKLPYFIRRTAAVFRRPEQILPAAIVPGAAECYFVPCAVASNLAASEL
jgi:hypothetical protein